MEGPARQLPRGPKLGWGGPGNTFGPTNITGMSPNKPGLVFEPGVAKLLRAGHDIILQMHCTTNGTEAVDRVPCLY